MRHFTIFHAKERNNQTSVSVRLIGLGINILLILLLLNIVSAFEVKPANISDEELQKIIANDPPDEKKISFWDLPLWIKLHHIASLLIGFVVLVKLLPFVIARIRIALENRKRLKILDFIRNNPGLSIAQLQDATGIDRNTLKYHLNILERENLITSVKVGNKRLLFAGEPLDMASLVVKSSEKKSQIMDFLSETDGIRLKEVSERMKISSKLLYYHVKELEKLGLVSVREGRIYLNRKASNSQS
jgi:predicted transcriptional regulator